MPRKPAHQQVDTIGTIQQHAFALFGRFGFEGVSIGDIAKRTGLSKGALYWHYKGKEDLYLDCLKRLHEIFDDYIFNRMRAEQDAVARILLLFRGLGQLLADPRVVDGLAGYWLIPLRPENEVIIATQRAFEARATQVIADTLRMGVQQGRFDYGDDLDEMARAIISLVETVVLPLRYRSPEEIHGMLGVLARTLFRAYARPGDLLNLTRML